MLCKDCDRVVAFVPPVLDDEAEADVGFMCVLCGTAIAFAGYLLPVAA